MSIVCASETADGKFATGDAPPAPLIYVKRCFWARCRPRLTWLGMISLAFISWRWGNGEMVRWSFVPGVFLTVIGVLLRIWSAGWLRKHEGLLTEGPYAMVRNPLYLGTGLLTLGQSLMSGVFWAPLVFPALWLALYLPAIHEEEEFLTERYGQPYLEYLQRVPLLAPRLRLRPERSGGAPGSTDRRSAFSWQQAWRNREYEAAIMNVVAIATYCCLAIGR